MTSATGTDGWYAIFNDATVPAHFSPHYDSYIWAVYLAAHAASEYAPLYERAAAAITHAMEVSVLYVPLHFTRILLTV